MGSWGVGLYDNDAASGLKAGFTDRYRSLDRPSWSLAGLPRPYGDGKLVLLERSVPLKKMSLSRFLRAA